MLSPLTPCYFYGGLRRRFYVVCIYSHAVPSATAQRSRVPEKPEPASLAAATWSGMCALPDVSWPV